jgi:hypothetical protein
MFVPMILNTLLVLIDRLESMSREIVGFFMRLSFRALWF